MNRTKVSILCFYILNMFVINALGKMNDSITAMSLCLSYLMIASVFIKNSLMSELKDYSPRIYDKLYEEKYVNGFKWLSYEFDLSENTKEDKNVKWCMIAHSILAIVVFIEIIVLGVL